MEWLLRPIEVPIWAFVLLAIAGLSFVAMMLKHCVNRFLHEDEMTPASALRILLDSSSRGRKPTRSRPVGR